MKGLTLAAALAAALLAAADAHAVTVGPTAAGPYVDSNAPGRAQDYRVTAAGTGTVNRLNVWLDAASTASSVELGLYSAGSSTAAGSRLARCVVTQPAAGRLNSCAISAVSVTDGSSYWLAILQPSGSSGSIYYRNASGGRTFGSSSGSLSALPYAWVNGPDWGAQTASVYADGATSLPATTTAAFTWSPASPVTGQSVTFDGTKSTCAASPCSYRWEDDGPDGPGGTQWPLGTGATMSFTFQHTGTKYVRLTVTDGHNQTATVEHDVVVTAGASPGPTPTPTPTPTPAPSPSSGGGQFPNASTTGVPPGWTPAQTRSTNVTVTTAGAVIQDIRFTNGAHLNIDAPNVTVRRVELQGGMINTDQPGVVIQDSTFDRAAPETTGGEGAVSYCGYTAIRVAIIERSEGFRDGCSNPTHIQDSYVEITPPDACGDWHGDGIQGYTGGDLYVSDVTIDFRETSACPGNAPFFFPGGQGNSAAYVNGLVVRGGGYSFRMGTPGSVQGLRVVQGTWPLGWHYGPISIAGDGGSCSAISPWEAKIVNVDSTWKVTNTVRDLPCGG